MLAGDYAVLDKRVIKLRYSLRRRSRYGRYVKPGVSKEALRYDRSVGRVGYVPERLVNRVVDLCVRLVRQVVLAKP